MAKSLSMKAKEVAPVSPRTTVQTETLFNSEVHQITECLPSIELTSTWRPVKVKQAIASVQNGRAGTGLRLAVRSGTRRFPFA